jgi:ubiquinone/menaquinone biosynthesis C-methylase UbiE
VSAKRKGDGGGEGGPERIDADYYDRSEYFEGRSEHLRDTDSPFQRYRLEKVLSIYHPVPRERVLDLGAGWGTFSFALAREAHEVVGVDFSEKSVAFCRSRLAASSLENLSFLRADARDTGLEPDSFDVVVAADLFEHLYPDDSVAVVAEARRVLKRGGRLVVWTPHRGHVLEILKNNGILLRPDPTHVDYKSMERLREMLDDAGFVIEKAYYAESHLPVLRTVERALMARVPWLRRRIAVLARKV